MIFTAVPRYCLLALKLLSTSSTDSKKQQQQKQKQQQQQTTTTTNNLNRVMVTIISVTECFLCLSFLVFFFLLLPGTASKREIRKACVPFMVWCHVLGLCDRYYTKFKTLYKCVMANTSAVWHWESYTIQHSNYHLLGSCSGQSNLVRIRKLSLSPFSVFKICGLWTLSCDFVPHN